MGIIRKQTLYTSTESVAVRLVNKVQFQRDPDNHQEGELSNDLFLQLIEDAETAVEQDLRGRYAIPFRSIRGGTFAQLPDHTRRAIRMVVDLKAAQMVLAVDFGGGSHLLSDNYTKSLSALYDERVQRLMGQDLEGEEKRRHRYTPPLDDLMLADSNSEADDGFRGTIIDGSSADPWNEPGNFAADQINNPAIGTFPNYRSRGY